MKPKAHQKWITNSQLIATLSERRKECRERATQAMLKGNSLAAQYFADMALNYSEQISDLHKPAYLKKKRKK